MLQPATGVPWMAPYASANTFITPKCSTEGQKSGLWERRYQPSYVRFTSLEKCQNMQ
jgi:hypothetical protein